MPWLSAHKECTHRNFFVGFSGLSSYTTLCHHDLQLKFIHIYTYSHSLNPYLHKHSLTRQNFRKRLLGAVSMRAGVFLPYTVKYRAYGLTLHVGVGLSTSSRINKIAFNVSLTLHLANFISAFYLTRPRKIIVKYFSYCKYIERKEREYYLTLQKLLFFNTNLRGKFFHPSCIIKMVVKFVILEL